MKLLLQFAISFLFFSHNCFAQVVWPGDVNNNGIVNGVDLLYLGFAFNETGSPRMNVSSEWVGQEVTTIWEGTFPNGLNFVYADCNGDGKVDEADAEILQTNLTKIHNDVPFIADEILDAIPEVDPKFTFGFDTVLVNPENRNPVPITVNFASTEEPFSDLVGIAFNINYDPMFFELGSPSFELLEDAWITPFGSQSTTLTVTNSEEGKITVASTITEGEPATGGGAIGVFSFVIIEDAIDLLVIEDTIKVSIDSITVVTDNLEKVPAVGATAIIEVEGRITSTYNPILDKIKLYPNPNNGWVLLQTNEVAIEKVELVNSLGQVVYQKTLNKNPFQSLDLQDIPKGIHWLRMITEYGTKSIPIERL